MFRRKPKEIEELEQKIRHLEMQESWNIIHYTEEKKKLEKALDKVCEKLEDFSLTMYEEGINFKPCIMKKELWKEWSLKESEKPQ